MEQMKATMKQIQKQMKIWYNKGDISSHWGKTIFYHRRFGDDCLVIRMVIK